MSVLLTHLVMATAHVIYVICWRHTSRSWGSVAELIALSQTSKPATDVLANTSGGIKSRKTFLQMAKIRVKKTPSIPNHEHLGHHDHVELLFLDSLDHQRDVSELELGELDHTPSRHATTWPPNTSKSPAHADLDARSTLSSTDRLAHNKEATDIVRPNQQYG